MRTPIDLKRVFLRAPTVAAVALLSLCALLLFDLINTYNRASLEQRAVDVARLIDENRFLTREGDLLASFVAAAGAMEPRLDIVVVGPDGQPIASTPAVDAPETPTKPDKALAPALKDALASGRFSSVIMLNDGRQAAILPLAPASDGSKDSGAPPAIAGEGIPTSYIGNLMFNGFQRPPLLSIALEPDQRIGGVVAMVVNPVAVQAARDWAFAGVGIIALALIAMLASIWVACKRYVVTPVETIRAMLNAQRSGERNARVPALETLEFDQLGQRWNTLIEERLASEQRERVLASVMEKLPVGVAIFDAAGAVRYVNPCLRAIGQLGDDRAQSLMPTDSGAIAGAKAWSGEVVVKDSKGRETLLEVTLSPVLDANGKLEHVIGVYHDITALKLNEHRLIEERHKAEAAMRAKADFIAMMSHELRTPLNAVIGFASIIANEQAGPINNPAYREFAQLIDQSANMLLSIINTIIDLNRLEKGASGIDEEAFQPGLLIERVVAAHAAEIAERGIAVSVVDRTRRAALNADPRQVRKIVSQLLSNAIKFNREQDPRIVIRTTIGRDGRMTITVADTGVGMRQDVVDRVTEPFFQADAGTARQHGGSGLGLTLVKAMVAAMGGELSIRSRPGRGTIVTVTFGPERTMRLGRRSKPRVSDESVRAAA